MTTAPLSLEHLIRPSQQTQGKPPVIFLFHGYGSNEEDLFSFAPELPGELCVISARAPIPLPPFGNAWYAINFEASQGRWTNVEQALASRELIMKFMDEACDAYGLDKDNITLLGFSQGTVLSYAIALSYPEKIKNLVALSGYIDQNLLLEDFREKDHSKLQVYASHGQIDQVIPMDWALKSQDMLEEIGVNHIFEEYPVGHGVSPQNFSSFKRWLEERLP
ncbi:alpha/beta hydrolase [Lentiprolixibacter aurantiacus]|uniref:Alpha/beta fold hydrolase n=1 Tax=Lentiprolixibacter aurantiacus TaxID=2993939 RepID=A0AAE3MKI7_9FLAO|nr:alpha/beta fold hydrolase [Lentiprolixibacter aurantiacus]MCX2719485.1 alpha/beta fold hydrolase [Lentiprolixibacter aurantiacus]